MNIGIQVWRCASTQCRYLLNDLDKRAGEKKKFCNVCLKKHRQAQARRYYQNRKSRPEYWADLQKKNHERYLLRKSK